jgi:membrane-bound lytic murein transglycosylase A
MFETKMNPICLICLTLFGTPVFADLTCSIDDGLYGQTDVLLDRDMVYAHAAFFPECIETDGQGLICSYGFEKKTSTFYRFEGDGSTRRPVSALLWKTENFDWQREPTKHEVEGALRQVEILKSRQKGTLGFERRDLLFVARCILKKEKTCRDGDIARHLRAQRLTGSDGRGNVQFTGYFTPEIEARKRKDDNFRYPIFKRPREWRDENGPHATREEIDKLGVLDGRGLEIAWTKRPLAIFMMQVQGSAIARFEDGSERLLAYDGKNGQPYVSIGRLLVEDGHISAKSISLDAIETFFEERPDLVEKYLYQNPSYVFFKAKGRYPKGAAGSHLTPGHSIAVDPKIIPYGAILIGKVPILGPTNRVVRHEWRLLFAQDTGGAIVGGTHVDLYTGIGEDAKNLASNMHHYGELWILLPNKPA